MRWRLSLARGRFCAKQCLWFRSHQKPRPITTSLSRFAEYLPEFTELCTVFAEAWAVSGSYLRQRLTSASA